MHRAVPKCEKGPAVKSETRVRTAFIDTVPSPLTPRFGQARPPAPAAATCGIRKGLPRESLLPANELNLSKVREAKGEKKETYISAHGAGLENSNRLPPGHRFRRLAMLPGAISEGNQCADGELSTAPSKRRTRKRPQPTGEHVMVPVAFNKHLGWGDAAFVLAEVCACLCLASTIVFMFAKLPLPFAMHLVQLVFDACSLYRLLFPIFSFSLARHRGGS